MTTSSTAAQRHSGYQVGGTSPFVNNLSVLET